MGSSQSKKLCNSLTQGRAINLNRGPFEKAVHSGELYLPKEIKASLDSVSLSTDIYCDKLGEISGLKIFPECFRGPHAAREPLISHPCFNPFHSIFLHDGSYVADAALVHIIHER